MAENTKGDNGGQAKPQEMVNITIDGKPVVVPKGTNLIEAAKTIGIEIPHYCYHPHLSIAGNCRMCQVEIKGAPKLEIGCNAVAREGMEVSTQHTSKAVADAQAATLEFILINHPLDCTVCDQAGHCKLQDYHYEYNARSSRFLENKEHKVKAEPLGPHVILDGERCIMCTRCIRFCDEVTETSELGMLNRGDRSVISINKGRQLTNPLSGSVVDLCPVGALTHRDWRFNTRIWFTEQHQSICPGCSTGCNVNVATRDGNVVQVKARLNAQVNKEWMCDEGRYGFNRFLPKNRLTTSLIGGKTAGLKEALSEAKKISSQAPIIFLSPDLLLEEYSAIKNLVDKSLIGAKVVIAYRERNLSKTEAILISPDYAANFRGAEFFGLVSGNLESCYNDALTQIKNSVVGAVLLVGERSIFKDDLNNELFGAFSRITHSVLITNDAQSSLIPVSKVVLPGRSILEKSGLLINRDERIQYTQKVIEPPSGSEAEWRIIAQLGEILGTKISNATEDRGRTLEILNNEPRLNGLTIAKIKSGGVCLKSHNAVSAATKAASQGGSSGEARA